MNFKVKVGAMRNVLLVGISPYLIQQLEISLGLRSFRAKDCCGAIQAIQLLTQSNYPMVIIGYDMTPISGFELILWLKQKRSAASLLVCGQGIPAHIIDFMEALNILVYDQRSQNRQHLMSLLDRGLTPFFSNAVLAS